MKQSKKKLLFFLMLLLLLTSVGTSSYAASSIKINKKTASLYPGQTVTLKISGTKSKVKWSSSSAKVAKVSAKGKVTAVKTGKATIKAKVGSKTLTCKVTVKAPALSSKNVILQPGKSKTVKLNGAKIKSVSSSKKSVATVNKQGKITGKKAGSCTVTFKDTKGKKYSCKVVVQQKVTGIKLSQTSCTLNPGESLTLKATVAPSNATDSSLNWSSSASDVVSVDQNGKITAKKAGSAVITASAKDGSRKSAGCTVTVNQKVTEITLSKAACTLNPGESLTLKATVAPSNATDSSLNWSSSASDVVSVDQSGKITAKKAGSAVITASAKDGSGKSAGCTVTVNQKVTGITLSQTTCTMNPGESLTLKATVAPSNATDSSLNWSSSASDVVSVDQNGKITAKKAGSAVITASAKDGSGKSAGCTVTVNPKLITEIQITPASICLDLGETTSLTLKIMPSDADNRNVIWSSSDSSIASVENGVVTGIAAGTAVISATTVDGTNLTSYCDVTVSGISDGEAVVSTQEELELVLSSESELRKLEINTQDAVNLAIPDVQKTATELVVNAPNAEISNQANFRQITIRAIADHTFIEKAIGNNIIYQAKSGRLIISEEARSTISVDSVDNAKIQLVNHGTLSRVSIETPAEIMISGSSTMAIPVISGPQSGGSTIETNQKLRLTAESKVNLVLNAGAEETRATVTDDSNIPAVSGLGRVSVKNETTGDEETVVAETDPEKQQEKLVVSGMVTLSDNSGLDNAALYLIPFSGSIDVENIRNLLNDDNRAAITSDGGAYSFEAALGNYYLITVAEGYIMNVQTLVMTSVNHENYSNATIVLAKEGENTGSVSGVLTDALTGKEIDYPVLLKIRKGINNLSGSALQILSVTADAYGRYNFSELTAGTYTIQVLTAPGCDTAIMSTSFTVVVESGVEAIENFTVTQLMESEQMRFVLTWGNESSGAPRDLDSHLVGPSGDGAGRFHTWYGEKNYYGDESSLYDNLDVDDVTWEGPETTTIYTKVAGIYSFYVFDFTDQSDEYSTRMSNKSSAVVNVYKGDILCNTFYVPTGQSGNLWHVCDYDSVTDVVTAVNEVVYWPDGGSSTVGMSALDILRQALSNKISQLTDYQEYLAEGAYKTEVQNAIQNANDVYSNSSEQELIQSTVAELNNYISNIENASHISNVTGENILRYSVYGNQLILYGIESEMGEIQIQAENDEAQELDVNITDISGQEYQKTVTVANEETGVTRIWYVYYRYDNREAFRITGIQNSEIIDYETEMYDDYGYLYLTGVTASLPDLILTVGEGVTYTISENEFDDTVIQMQLTGSEQTYWYYVYYSRDTSAFAIEDVTGENIKDYSVNRSNNDAGYLTIYGTTAEIPDFELTVKEGVSYTVTDTEESGYVKKITMDANGSSYMYYVSYRPDKSVFEIKAVTGENVKSFEVWQDYTSGELELYGTEVSLPEFDLEVNEGISWSIDRDEEGDVIITLTNQDGYTYKYYVYYRLDKSVFEITGVTGEGVSEYSVDQYNYNGYLHVTGTTEFLPNLTLTVGEGVTYTIGEDEDADTVIQMQLTGSSQTYRYYVYYSRDTSAFEIEDVIGENIKDYSIGRNNNAGYLTIYGTTAEIPDFELTVKEGVSYTITDTDEPGYVKKITMDANGSSYMYYVSYRPDKSVFEIKAVTGENVKSFDVWQGYTSGELELYGTEVSLPEFDLEVNDGISWSIGQDEEGGVIITLTNQDGYTYEYYVYYSRDTSVFQIINLESSEIISWQENRNAEQGTLSVRGFSDTMPEYNVEVNEGVQVVEKDDSSITLQYGDCMYVYTIIYLDASPIQIQSGSTEMVNLTEEKPYMYFIFTPDETAEYCFESFENVDSDPYCRLYQYQENGLLDNTSYDDDGGDDRNFRLQQQFEQGKTYYFEAYCFGNGVGSYQVRLTKCDSVTDTEEFDLQDELSVESFESEIIIEEKEETDTDVVEGAPAVENETDLYEPSSEVVESETDSESEEYTDVPETESMTENHSEEYELQEDELAFGTEMNITEEEMQMNIIEEVDGMIDISSEDDVLPEDDDISSEFAEELAGENELIGALPEDQLIIE